MGVAGLFAEDQHQVAGVFRMVLRGYFQFNYLISFFLSPFDYRYYILDSVYYPVLETVAVAVRRELNFRKSLQFQQIFIQVVHIYEMEQLAPPTISSTPSGNTGVSGPFSFPEHWHSNTAMIAVINRSFIFILYNILIESVKIVCPIRQTHRNSTSPFRPPQMELLLRHKSPGILKRPSEADLQESIASMDWNAKLAIYVDKIIHHFTESLNTFAKKYCYGK